MKTKCLTKFIALACLCMLFSACDDSDPVIIDNSHTNIGNNFADFTVTNVTTGEQAVNDLIVIGESNFLKVRNDFTVTNVTTGEQAVNDLIVIGESNFLKVRNGDVLRLSYNPPAEYKDYSRTVEYTLFDETFTVDPPYTKEYTVKDVSEGEYGVTCADSIYYDDDLDIIYTGKVTLRVVNE